MSKLQVGQRVTVSFSDTDAASGHSVHMIDKDTPVYGEVVYVHESGNVNVVVRDHSGSTIALTDIPDNKKGNDIYATAVK